MKRCVLALFALAVTLCYSTAGWADVDPLVVENLTPIQDTYATHDDGIVHGFETVIRVGIEPQQCQPNGSYDPCPKDDLECCPADDGYNFCAPPGECATTPPSWKAHRKYRGYLRFNLNSLPEGQVQSASLRLTELDKVQQKGGPFKITITALKKIGLGDNETCEWYEQTLNDTNGTTWNVLPQNLSVSPEGVWAYDVTKAVTDWVNGNSDKPGNPVMPNCGFHVYDDEYGNQEAPIMRWVDFGSKESGHAPQLKVIIAQDLDDDGYFGDCNEEDPDIHPGATETCDGVDEDCDGATDEENCDGVDNDCDGFVDEDADVDMCGEGMACIYHECYVTCEDECGGPTSLKCELNDDGIWEKWACKADEDYDPCLEWYKVMDCEPDEFCQFGYCSGNCVDICDPEELGFKQCHKDSVGNWSIAECGDWEDDGCLDWGNLAPCGPGATCEGGVCGVPCTDECPAQGDLQCKNDSIVQACIDADDDGCLEWSDVGNCDPINEPCVDGACKPEGPVCEDECEEGQSKCEADGASAQVSQCVADGDEDPCLEWGAPQACPDDYGCNDDNTACAEEACCGEPAAEPHVELPLDVWTGPTPDGGGEGMPEVTGRIDGHVAPGEVGGAEVAAGGDLTAPGDGSWWVVDGAVEEEKKKKKKSGCAVGGGPAGPAELLWLLLVLGLARTLARRRWALR